MPPYNSDEALDILRAKLRGDSRAHAEGEGKVILTRLDGGKVVIDNVRVDSVGPGAENAGVIGVELFREERVIHVPFISHWEFDFRV